MQLRSAQLLYFFIALPCIVQQTSTYTFFTQVYLSYKLTFRLVVMLTASTSNWSEIRLPIIRAYLGCKHRSSSKINSRRPHPLFDLRQIAIGRRKKGTSPGHRRKVPHLTDSHPQEEACQNVHTYEISFAVSFAISNTEIFVENSERYRRPCFRPFETCRRVV